MILVLKRGISEADKADVQRTLRRDGCAFTEFGRDGRLFLEVAATPGQGVSEELCALPGVEDSIVKPSPFRLVGREAHPENTIVQVGDVAVGGERIVVIAGPCSIESRDQALGIAGSVRRYGAVLFRGGAFKPRSSPYSFQGLGQEGLEILGEVRERTGLRIVSEVVSTDKAEAMLPYVDILQVGARNMQNFELLKCVGRLGRPVLLKRGLSATIEEWLMSAEYVLAEGNPHVILCERGIRTFEPYTRNTLDLSAIPIVRRLTHLPVIIDPSHATGIREKVSPMGRAAIAAGADGLMIEVHDRPEKALSDGAQSLLPEQFGQLMRDIYVIAPVIGKQLDFGYLDKAKAVAAPAREEPAGRLSVALVGDAGTFSHKACTQYFGASAGGVPVSTSRRVFESVREGEARFGIVPLENSLTGSVHENYDLLLELDLRIVGEIMLRIEYSLIGRPGTRVEQVRRVFSHPEVFRQCQPFIENQHWELVSTRDEATAVKVLREKGTDSDAAIAGRDAAELHGMALLQEGIEANPRNYTRFGVIGTRALTQGRRTKSSLIYQTKNRPGALYETLGLFADNSINLVKLESRPIHGQPWEYMFYVDVEADAEAPEFEPVLEELRRHADFLKVLGAY